MKALSAVTLTILALSATGASADRIDHRRGYQLNQIEAGRESGTLTWREGRKLRREQAAIARAEYDMKSDGQLSRHERHMLRNMQQNAQERIIHEKHDGWRRPWWLRRFGY